MKTLEECIESLELMSSINWQEKAKHADVLHYLAELKSGGWISVKDRLPEVTGTYLTFCRYRDGSTGQKIKLYRPDMGFTSEPKQVTYWRPLPPDPEEVSND